MNAYRASSVSTAETPPAILRPVRVVLHMTNLRRQARIFPIDLATSSRTGIKADWVWQCLAFTAWHASITGSTADHAFIPDKVMLRATPQLDTRITSPMVGEDDQVVSPAFVVPKIVLSTTVDTLSLHCIGSTNQSAGCRC